MRAFLFSMLSNLVFGVFLCFFLFFCFWYNLLAKSPFFWIVAAHTQKEFLTNTKWLLICVRE